VGGGGDQLMITWVVRLTTSLYLAAVVLLAQCCGCPLKRAAPHTTATSTICLPHSLGKGATAHRQLQLLLVPLPVS
jgi:hypothetical protein